MTSTILIYTDLYDLCSCYHYSWPPLLINPSAKPHINTPITRRRSTPSRPLPQSLKYATCSPTPIPHNPPSAIYLDLIAS